MRSQKPLVERQNRHEKAIGRIAKRSKRESLIQVPKTQGRGRAARPGTHPWRGYDPLGRLSGRGRNGAEQGNGNEPARKRNRRNRGARVSGKPGRHEAAPAAAYPGNVGISARLCEAAPDGSRQQGGATPSPRRGSHNGHYMRHRDLRDATLLSGSGVGRTGRRADRRERGSHAQVGEGRVCRESPALPVRTETDPKECHASPCPDPGSAASGTAIREGWPGGIHPDRPVPSGAEQKESSFLARAIGIRQGEERTDEAAETLSSPDLFLGTLEERGV